MPIYHAPLRDIDFILNEIVGIDAVARLPGYEEATPDLVRTLVEESAKLCENILLPLNRTGDEEGCAFENGVVRTPKGFKEAYDAYVKGGWTGLTCAPEWGGQGMPNVLGFVLSELMCATNLSFATYPGLSHGAYSAIERHAEPDLKAVYLPKLASGEWTGTMCLTESHCGTDLGLIRTKAIPAGNGTYKITGTKIFISAGEHDLTSNIIHLVLAKLPDAPPGTKGISLFLVPKFLVNDDGSVGARNGIACGGIEHKMGIKASSTCVINLDDATGWLVGEMHGGMRAMFTMMNGARLGVGIQGIGLAEVAYQNALNYARERLQGRALKGPAFPDKAADPIIVHPDVRKNLLTMRAYTEGARALAYWVGVQIDISQTHPDEAARDEAEEFVALITPIVKALFTDIGFEVTNLGVQIYGGHGYIREHGMEQFVRDARIAQLYEGTNGIQALDLVGRKLGKDYGRLLRRFFHPLEKFLSEHATDKEMAELIGPLAKAFGKLQQATVHIAQVGLRDPEEAGAAATDYLRLFGLVALGFMWARMAKVASAKANGGDDRFHDAKLSTARFYMQKILPQTQALFITIMAGKKTLMEPAADWF